MKNKKGQEDVILSIFFIVVVIIGGFFGLRWLWLHTFNFNPDEHICTDWEDEICERIFYGDHPSNCTDCIKIFWTINEQCQRNKGCIEWRNKNDCERCADGKTTYEQEKTIMCTAGGYCCEGEGCWQVVDKGELPPEECPSQTRVNGELVTKKCEYKVREKKTKETFCGKLSKDEICINWTCENCLFIEKGDD